MAVSGAAHNGNRAIRAGGPKFRVEIAAAGAFEKRRRNKFRLSPVNNPQQLPAASPSPASKMAFRAATHAQGGAGPGESLGRWSLAGLRLREYDWSGILVDAMAYSIWQQQISSDVPFVVVSMFTRDYLARAERLLRSLRKFALPHAIMEVPNVHRSISAKGNDDFAFCKARLIEWALQNWSVPVLYVDCDCEFVERPDYILALRREETDFAIYNWYSDLMNDAWLPHEGLTKRSGQPLRYWRYSHHVDEFSTSQIACSGGVQYWGNTRAALTLLQEWAMTLAKFPKVADDECLTHAFNFTAAGSAIRTAWLPKEYMRCAWWIYVKPVINHPELPAGEGSHFEVLENPVHRSRLITDVGKAGPFPRASIIDAQDKVILMRHVPNGPYNPTARLSAPLFI